MSKCTNCPNTGKHAFCSLGKTAKTYLEANSILMEYPRGTVLFRQGDQSNAVFVLCAGKVKVSVTSKEGRTMIMRIAEAGGVLGMSAALANGEHEVTVEALEPCRARVLHLKHLTAMLEQYKDASMGAALAMAEDYRAAFEGARLMALPTSPAGRLAQLILGWADEAKRSSSAFVTMPLTHEELAEMTATTRETVTRTLGRFRKEKIISTHGVALTVLQPQMLEQLSGC